MILAILMLASFLRLYNLGSNPPSLYWEEAALGYDAYSIWTTGKDYHGNSWPIVAFESFGDFKPSGYFYFLSPLIGVFGLNEWAVRLPSALAGIMTVYLVYLVIREISRNHYLGLAAAFGLAIMPWHVFISRVGFEANLGLMWLMLSLLLTLKAAKNNKFMLAAVIPLAFSMYTYHGLRVIAPLMIIVTGLFFVPIQKVVREKIFYVTVVFLIGLLTPILINVKDPVVSQRFNEVNYLTISPAVSITNSLREKYSNSWWSKIVFHRYWFWAAEIIRNGASHFSPQFLFIKGDGNARHQNPDFGILSWWTLPFIIASFWSLRQKRNKKLWWYGLLLLIISTLPASLSFPTPHTLRTLPAVLGWSLIISLGGYIIFNTIKNISLKYILAATTLVVITYSSVVYWHALFTSYPEKYSDSWQYGYKQAITFVSENLKPNESVYLTREYGRPSIYVMFYAQVAPHTVQNESPTVPKDQSELLRLVNWDFEFNPIKEYDWVIDHQSHSDPNYLLKKVIDNGAGSIFYIYKRDFKS